MISSFRASGLARNVSWLGLRMVLLLVINLVVTRLLLDGFGTDVYGVWTTAVSVVALGSFIPNTVGDVTMRFLSMAHDAAQARIRFRVSVRVNMIASFLLMLMACGGLLWMRDYASLAPGMSRQEVSVLIGLVGTMMFFKFLCQPYFGLMFARERFGMFASFSIVEGIAMLLCAYAARFMADPLLGYAFMMAMAETGLLCAVVAVSRLTMKDIFAAPVSQLCNIAGEFTRFLGWVLLGGFAMTLWVEGATVCYNGLYGVEASAVMGIAMLVLTRLRGVMSGIQKGVVPRIMSVYVSDREAAGRLTLHLMLWSVVVVGVGALAGNAFMPRILELWLGTVPEGLTGVMKAVLVIIILESVSLPASAAVQASGSVQSFELWESSALLLMLPALYVAYIAGCSMVVTAWTFVAVDVIVTGIRLYFAVKAFAR